MNLHLDIVFYFQHVAKAPCFFAPKITTKGWE